MRILFSSNAPYSTSGYAQQMHDLLPKIKALGHEVAISCFYGLEGGKISLDGITCYPKIADTWGSDAAVMHQQDFKADIVITFQDIWVMDVNNLRKLKNWIPMLPVDHDPVPQAVLDRARLAYRIITHSQFGYKQLKNKGVHSTYIPLLVNTNIYKPMDKAEARKQMGIPEDIFLFGMVSANKDFPPRKSFQEVMDAFVVFLKDHPNSGIYFHTFVNQPGGFPIMEYAKFLGIHDKIYYIDQYQELMNTDKSKMALIINSFDCLLAPSTNEGFGVPIIEAQACGVPVITNDFTSMPELVEIGKTGFVTKILQKRFTPLLAYSAVPDPKSIYELMCKVYKSDRKEMGRLAREKMEKEYALDLLVEKGWKPFLEKVEKELKS